jgi:hypothetical protein
MVQRMCSFIFFSIPNGNIPFENEHVVLQLTYTSWLKIGKVWIDTKFLVVKRFGSSFSFHPFYPSSNKNVLKHKRFERLNSNKK